jgi:hypothetical protein
MIDGDREIAEGPSVVGRTLPFCRLVLPNGNCPAVARGSGQNLAKLKVAEMREN